MKDELEKMQQQLIDNYKKALEETITNNTDTLINEDVLSILKEPPLESMDILKKELYRLTKHEKLILEKEKVDKIFNEYYEYIINNIKQLGTYRIDMLNEKVSNYKFKNDFDVVKIDKETFNKVNKYLKTNIKKEINNGLKIYLSETSILQVFKKDDKDINQKVIKDFQKYYNKYIKQVISNVEMKIMIKDSILNNVIKDQGERYIFTKTNSRVYQ